MLKKRYFIVTGAIVLAAAVMLIGWLLFHKKQIVVHTARPEQILGSGGANFSGKLEAVETVNVMPKITGRVSSLMVDIGSVVQAGDVLLTIDSKELTASMAQAQAALELARSTLRSAGIDYAVQKQNLERNKALLDQGALSKSEFDNKVILPYQKAEEALASGATAQVAKASAGLQLAQANYDNSVLVSPINGVVTAKNINIGELASPEVTLFSLVNLDKMYVVASIPEEKISDIKIGAQIPVRIGAISERPFVGNVAQIAQGAGAVTKTYLVKVLLDNKEHLLKPGMFAEALWGQEPIAEMVIPKTALVMQAGKYFVWVVNNGIVAKQEVDVGAEDVFKVRAKNGIGADQEVVVQGQEQLQEGMRVEVQY